jgi:hypothetical protein
MSMSTPYSNPTPVDRIADWLNRGIGLGATHVIVCTDSYSVRDYRVYLMPGDDLKPMIEQPGEGQTVKEVYNLSLDIEPQLLEYRRER